MSIEREANDAAIWWITQEREQMQAMDAYEAGCIQSRKDAPKEVREVAKPLSVAQVSALAAELWDQGHGTKFDDLSLEDQQAREFGLYQILTRAGIPAEEP